jgi:hypothetical protein
MSLSLLITINIVAAVALLAGLAHAMSHPRRLKPHVASVDASQALKAERTPATRRHPRPARPELARVRASRAGHAGSHAAAAGES